MPTGDKKDIITDLGTDVAAMAKGIAAAGCALKNATLALQDQLDKPVRGWLLLRTALVSWNLSISKRDEKTFLLFWKKLSPEQVVLRSSLSLRIEPSPPEPTSTAIDLEKVIYQLVIPSVVVFAPSSEDLPPKEIPIVPEESIVLRVGPEGKDRLLFEMLEFGIRRIAYAVDGVWRRVDGQGGKWEVEPFVALIRALVAWRQSSLEEGKAIEIQVSGRGEEEPDAKLFLRRMAEIFAWTKKELREPHDDLASSSFALGYGVSEFEADTEMRIDAKGNFAAKRENALFGLRCRVKALDEEGRHILRISADLPDFLASGSLYDAFLDAICKEIDEDLAEELGFGDDVGACQRWLRAAESIFFRTSRDGEKDIDAAVFLNTWEGEDWLVILEVEARVDVTVEPPTVEIKDLECKCDVPATGTQVLDKESSEYFFRLISSLKVWLKVLP